MEFQKDSTRCKRSFTDSEDAKFADVDYENPHKKIKTEDCDQTGDMTKVIETLDTELDLISIHQHSFELINLKDGDFDVGFYVKLHDWSQVPAEVIRKFEPGFFKIDSIYKVTNSIVSDRYDLKKQILLDSKIQLNEKYLYHLSQHDNLDKILAQGLDHRIGKFGMFGRASYFADEVFKANMYFRESIGNIRTILVSSVILGKSLEYQYSVSNKTLLRPPKGYHSVKGNITGHDEYAIYKMEQIRIDYVVKYYVSDQTWEETIVRAWLYRYKHRNPNGIVSPAMLDSIRKAIRVHPVFSIGYLPQPQTPSSK